MSTLESKKICRSCKYSSLEMNEYPCTYCTVPEIRRDFFEPKTNLDKIREMPIEEMAKVICTTLSEAPEYCQNKQECNDMLNEDKIIPDEWCVQCAREWLERKVEE